MTKAQRNVDVASLSTRLMWPAFKQSCAL